MPKSQRNSDGVTPMGVPNTHDFTVVIIVMISLLLLSFYRARLCYRHVSVRPSVRLSILDRFKLAIFDQHLALSQARCKIET